MYNASVVQLIVSLIILIIMGSIRGIATNMILQNRGYHESWFWLGFFFGSIAMLVALSRSDRVVMEKIQESVRNDARVQETFHGQSACSNQAVRQMHIQDNETAAKEKEMQGTGKANCLRIPIVRYNHAPELRPISLTCQPYQEQYAFVLKLKCDRENKISAVMVDIILHMEFGEIYEIHDLGFTNFEHKVSGMTSGMTLYSFPQAKFILIQKADIVIKKYVEDGRTIEFTEEEMQLSPYEETLEEEHIRKEVIREAEALAGSVQIYKYLQNYNLEKDGILDEELLNIAKHHAGVERLYGNTKDACIKQIKEYFEV